jgi:NAD(P)-dependent dehydrogenase (short-subunit alcohol dehydrogenase family)
MNTTWLFGASGTIGFETCSELLNRGDTVLAFCSSKDSKIKLDFHFANLDNFESRIIDLNLISSIQEVVMYAEDSKYAPKHVIFLARGSSPINLIPSDQEWVTSSISDLMVSLIIPIRICIQLLDKSKASLKTITLVSSQYGVVSQDPKLYEDPDMQMSAMYSAIRGGIISGVRALAIIGAQRKVRINCLTLGGISESTEYPLKNSIESRLPSENMIPAADAANWLLFFASEKSAGAIGSSVVVDNGWTII